MKKYRIGIVGTGGVARRHIEGYRAVAGERSEVVAGCDPDQNALDNFCTTYKVPHRFTSLEALIASGEVDVISVLTPPAVRSEIILPAIEQGLHLLVEKPFAETLAEAITFVEAAEQAGTILAVNQQLRFMPDILAVRELLMSDAIGEIRFIAHDHFQNRTQTKGWRKDEARLEISIFSIHLLDRIRWLFEQPPEAVMATTRHWDGEVQGETFTTLTIHFAGGGVGSMVSNWHALMIPECRLRIDGTTGSILSQKGSIVADGASLLVHQLGQRAKQTDYSRQNAFTMALGESMKRLIEAIDTNSPPTHSGRDNLQTMAIVDAAYLSASRGGARVDIAEIWPGGEERLRD